MQAQTAARYEDVPVHVAFTGTSQEGSRLLLVWDQTRVWGGIASPETGRRLRASPNKPNATSSPACRFCSRLWSPISSL
eukprot:scaffold1200_cov60-Phaeocystis_antarctica.AAC.4